MNKHRPAQASATAHASISLQTWHWYSTDQAKAAALFARRSGELERTPPPPSPEEQRRGLTLAETSQAEHRSYVIAAVTASVAFLEASINELCTSASYDNLALAGGQGTLPAHERDALRDLAPTKFDRLAILDRYQLVLHLLHRTPYDQGAAPFQDTTTLIKLRNELVHPKPQWRDAGEDPRPADQGALAQQLAAKHFPHNPFTGGSNPFFPDKCLGHGCARWGWQTALTFADDFFTRLGITPIHDHIRPHLTV